MLSPQLAEDLACGAEDAWCGCSHDEVVCGPANELSSQLQLHPLTAMQQLYLPLGEDPDLECCNMSDCYTCFLSQVGWGEAGLVVQLFVG